MGYPDRQHSDAITSKTPPTVHAPPPQTTSSIPRENPFWTWFDSYLKGIIGISVFGGQITFTVVVSDIADPASAIQPDPSNPDPTLTPVFSKHTVRIFIGISWLLFTFALGIAVLINMVVSEGESRKWVFRVLGGKGWEILYIVATFLMNGFLLAAFLFLALSAAAYVPVIGWAGTAFVSIFALVVGTVWLFLNVIGWS